MKRMGVSITSVTLAGVVLLAAGAGAQSVLTADQAVRMALERNSQIVGANALVLGARGGLYSAYSRMLPGLSADLTRSGTRSDKATGQSLFGSVVTPSSTTDRESYSTTPSLSASWPLLNLSSIAGLSSARSGLKASQLSRQATRADVALAARQQFYQVVQAVKLVEVSGNALKLARDSERRVRALFEVGSVSRNDVLQAEVQTAQSQLDSIAARQSLLVQRDLLASFIGIEEARLGEVDTVLTFAPREYDEPTLLTEAQSHRPDLQAATAQLRSSRASVLSARMARLPYVTVQAGASFDPFSSFKQKIYGNFPVTDAAGDTIGYVQDPVESGRSKTQRQYSASISLSMDLFDGFAMDARVATARAQLLRDQDAYDVLRRNLAGEVHEAVLTYRQAVASEVLAESAVASASESMKLTQQKYNVGSATILDLITAQVALERAQSQLVNALAAIRVAEARIDRVRGQSE